MQGTIPTQWYRDWVVFASNDKSIHDVCSQEMLADEPSEVVSPGDDPGYPDIALTFDTFGIEGCKCSGGG